MEQVKKLHAFSILDLKITSVVREINVLPKFKINNT